MRDKRLKSQPGVSYGAQIRSAVLVDYMSGVSRKELAVRYKIYNPSVISHWIRKFSHEIPLLDSSKMKKT